jgi:hypothetical protein
MRSDISSPAQRPAIPMRPIRFGYLGRGTTIGDLMSCASGGRAGVASVGPFVFCTAATTQTPLRLSATMVINPNRWGRAEPSTFLSPWIVQLWRTTATSGRTNCTCVSKTVQVISLNRPSNSRV